MKQHRTRPSANFIVCVILSVILILVAFFGIRYTITKDINNGVNHTGGEGTVVTGQIPLVKGQAEEQPLIVYQDFEGVSLLLDHTKAADFRYVQVTLIRQETGETVLKKRIPVWSIRSGEYTFFAAQKTIENDGPHYYRILVETGGIGGGLITMKTGTLAGDDSGETSVLYGIVNDYRRNPVEVGMTAAAVAVLCFWLVVMILCLRGFSKKKSGKQASNEASNEEISPQKISGMAERGRNASILNGRAFFLFSYCCIAAFCLLSAAANSDRCSWSEQWLGNPYGGSVEINDDLQLDQTLVVPGPQAAGVFLEGYSRNGLVLTDEELDIVITDVITGRQVQRSTINLSDASAYNTGLSTGTDRIYIPFDARFREGRKITLHLETHGIIRTGILIGTSEAGENLADQALYLSGEKQNIVLRCGFYVASYSNNVRSILLMTGLCAALGIVLAFLGRKKNLPGFFVPLKEEKADHCAPALPSEKAEKKHFLKKAILLSAAGLLLLEWGYSTSVSVASKTLTPAISVIVNDRELTEWHTLPQKEEALSQIFTGKDDRLLGVGLALSGTSYVSALDGLGQYTVCAELYDEDGNLLTQAAYRLEDLDSVKDKINQTSQSLSEVSDYYWYIPFDETVENALGRQFRLLVYTTDADTIVRAACRDTSLGGGLNLITLYEGYRILPAFYAGVMSAFLVLLVVLFRVTESPFRRPVPDGGRLHWERVFLLTLFGVGVLFSLIIPFYSVPDEQAHINTIYALADRFLGVYGNVGYGYTAQRTGDAALNTYVESVGLIPGYPRMIRDLFHTASGTGYQAVYYQDTMSNTTVFNFLPAVFGMTLGRVLNLSMPTLVLLSRWGMLLVSGLLIFLGIRKCPVGKRAIMSIALFPMFLQMITSCSYDAMILASSVLFIGSVLHVLSDSEVSLCDLVVVVFSGLLLLLNKSGVYAPVLCLILLLPLFRKRKMYKWGTLLIVIAAAAVVTAFFLPGFIRNFVATPYYGGIYYTLPYLAAHPVQLLHLVESTLMLNSNILIDNQVADGMASFYIGIPYYLTAAICVIFWLSANRRDADRKERLPRRSIPWMGAIIVLGFVFLFTAGLLTMTTAGASRISGLQGRYFLPYAVILAVMIGGKEGKPTAGASKDHSVIDLYPDRPLFWMACADFVTALYVFQSLYAG